MRQIDLFEKRKKEKALDLLEEFRATLIFKAKKIAVRLAINNGTVTSPEVLEVLERECDIPKEIDRRFMGAVFRKDWERVGFSSTGSHCQPISIWKLK